MAMRRDTVANVNVDAIPPLISLPPSCYISSPSSLFLHSFILCFVSMPGRRKNLIKTCSRKHSFQGLVARNLVVETGS